MSENSRSKINAKSIVIDLVITGIVWLLFTLWFRSHVPSHETATVYLVAGFSALPAAGVFYLCLHMFKVTLAHQRELKSKSE